MAAGKASSEVWFIPKRKEANGCSSILTKSSWLDMVMLMEMCSKRKLERPCQYMCPFAFKDYILFMKAAESVSAYHLKTERLENICGFLDLTMSSTAAFSVVYEKSLLPV
ncbi:hypothetical protein GIB67_011778 [Kingdonia uniflora]|uniref:Uncharacterized protein n=1 Tax=Kingdonia uniflora TaxID=39325 RepID=A0A7J7NXF7_9MAGN|nr:hypothetical protein GIB67_011778 [Kingdonia uniflora]